MLSHPPPQWDSSPVIEVYTLFYYRGKFTENNIFLHEMVFLLYEMDF